MGNMAKSFYFDLERTRDAKYREYVTLAQSLVTLRGAGIFRRNDLSLSLERPAIFGRRARAPSTRYTGSMDSGLLFGRHPITISCWRPDHEPQRNNDPFTMVQNQGHSPVRSLIRSSNHSFDCSALLALLARSRALIHSCTRSLTHSLSSS